MQHDKQRIMRPPDLARTALHQPPRVVRGDHQFEQPLQRDQPQYPDQRTVQQDHARALCQQAIDRAQTHCSMAVPIVLAAISFRRDRNPALLSGYTQDAISKARIAPVA